MLIFLSDLHFIDETAGQHNIPKAAFEGVFRDIKTYGGTPSEVKIVFLGDIFDLVRTTRWHDAPEAERPWGDVAGKRNEIEVRATAILDEIVEKNRAFHFLKTGLRDIFGTEPEKIYIPGNHDRLCNLYPGLRERVRNALGIPGDREPFPHAFIDRDSAADYRVYALHGHEYDPWNFERVGHWTEADYAAVPIGDLIACEFVSKLPMRIVSNLDSSFTAAQKELIKRTFQEMDNVRPFFSILKWIFYQVADRPELGAVVGKSLKQIAEEFEALTYYKAWRKRKAASGQWCMVAEMQALITIAKCFNLRKAESLLKAFAGLGSIFGAASPDVSDTNLNRGANKFLTEEPEHRSLVMGHTHKPLQMPVRMTRNNTEQVYLNTGTWRKRYVQGSAEGYIGLKYITYAVFYNREENPTQFYETWTGTLKDGNERMQ